MARDGIDWVLGPPGDESLPIFRPAPLRNTHHDDGELRE
jgi:hypothetical protein